MSQFHEWMSARTLRACDADRERTVAVLTREVGTGRLTLDEFSERATAAYTARTLDGLAALTADLPRGAAAGPCHPRFGLVPALLGVALLLAVVLVTLAAIAGAAMGGLSWCH